MERIQEANVSNIWEIKIANLIISLDWVESTRVLDKFICKSGEHIVFKFEILKDKVEELELKSADILEEENICLKYRNEVMLIDKEWKTARVLPYKNKHDVFVFLRVIFYTHAVQRHMIQFHSSLIDYQGHGLMFLGPSGIGKTTQAELWNQYRDALIINGDIVFVQETEEAFLGWGTPWHGSSPYCENTNVPVDALIILKQAPENSIRKLEGFEKVTAVSNSVFYPRWLENGMELCLETLDHLLSKLPVYELSCRPDEEAVALTEQTIFGGERF